MGMNLLNENEYISCPKCKNRTFNREKIFALKKIKNTTGAFIKMESVSYIYRCSKCSEDITKLLEINEVI